MTVWILVVNFICISGKGHYYLKGAVEDSATAEISRSQVKTRKVTGISWLHMSLNPKFTGNSL